MGLWNGSVVDDMSLRWSSKRLTADLALDDAGDTNASDVTRADRLGRAASGAFGRAAVTNVFEEAEWNGRLQAPRAQLDRIATLLDKGKTKQAETLRHRLRWLVSFSPRLRPSGPFIEYAASHGIEPNRRTGEYYPNAPGNKGREGLAKLVLARLPGLRILSVDLGHRFAAACAVWETLSRAALKSEIVGLNVLAGGSTEGDLYLHVEKPGRDGSPRTVIYRRIGPDKLVGGDHPAPWARLDRQFLIKLQGEEKPARWASRQETDMVRGWEKALGRARDEAADPLPHRIDELMAEAITMLRRALRRHGDRARIAFNLTSPQKLTAGGGQKSLDRAGRVELLTHTLTLWHGLFSGERWADPWAAEEWKKRGLPEVAMAEDEDASGAQRWTRRRALEDTLRPHAERLADQDLSEWSATWTTRWRRDDAALSSKTGMLQALKRWIAPRGLRSTPTDDEVTLVRKKAARATARHVGGLSLTRIGTISGLYQLLKAFKMRPEPDDLRRNIPKRGDDELEDFNRRLLDMRDRLREQRVKQLASRIVEASLGIGRVKISKEGKSPERPRQAVDVSCHAVVIESLTHYRPDDLRTRRENRQLMQWSSAKVQKYLKESCQLHGIHLREVPANYTSRQCSRTGLPGVRCDDVPVKDFLTAPWWNKIINVARKKIEKNSTDAKDHLLVDLADRLQKIQSGGGTLPSTVRVPRPGGELFVAAPPWDVLQTKAPNFDRLTSRAVQADINAAANIGLRALLDPDWAGRWWYVPCKSGSSEPATERVRGSAAFEGITHLPTNAESPSAAGIDKTQRAKKPGKDGKEIENLWRDPATDSLHVGPWKNWAEYWNGVQARVTRVLRKRSELP
jgi:IS605 OrfB family transposase